MFGYSRIMSGEQPERGWWLATDDQWYPPELHPEFGERIDVSADGFDTIEHDEIVNEVAQSVSSVDDPETDLDSEDGPDSYGVVDEQLEKLPEASAASLPDAPTVDHHVIGFDPELGLVDRLLELSDRRVAGLLDGDQFAEAQRQLLTGD